jgi:hypothetical protein
MPDLVTLRKIGFRHTPDWHKEKMARRPLRTRSDVLQSILNRNTNDAASEADSDDSDATLAEVPHHLAVAPSTTPVQNTLVPAPSTFDLLSFDDDEDEPQLPKVPNNTPETSAYALPNLGPNRQGRFVPAGEELPRMSAPPLQPSPASSIVENKEEPKAIKPIYTPLARAAPVFNEYFKEQKATKSQEKLLLAKKEEEGSKSISNLESEKDAQIAKLQRKLAEVEAQRKLAESTAATKTPPTAPKSASPAPAPTLVVAAPISAKNGLLASKHSEGEVQAKGRSKSKAKDIQKPSEGATSKGRRLPAGRARKVATTKTGEKENVVAKK